MDGAVKMAPSSTTLLLLLLHASTPEKQHMWVELYCQQYIRTPECISFKFRSSLNKRGRQTREECLPLYPIARPAKFDPLRSAFAEADSTLLRNILKASMITLLVSRRQATEVNIEKVFGKHNSRGGCDSTDPSWNTNKIRNDVTRSSLRPQY